MVQFVEQVGQHPARFADLIRLLALQRASEDCKRLANGGAHFSQSLLEQSLGANRENFVRTATNELEHALATNPRRAEILEGFHALRSDEAAA